ncbi:MAG TPA: SHOCT domain-containing protein [Candidatus Angelobacter sp.]
MAPGLLVELGAFGRIDMNSAIPGTLALLWVVGYLLQFAVFMWIMNIVAEQKVLWWFVASLLPWAVDWTLPVSPLFFLLWFPITLAVAGWIVLVARRAESFQEHGIRATGVVLEVLKPWMNVVINNVYIKRKVRLRIEREDRTPAYEGVLNGLFMLGEIPSAGDRLPLLVDPTNPQRFEYDKGTDPEPAAPVRSTAPPATVRGNIADELAKLANLRDRGALTDSEFNAAKKKLLRD